MFSWSESYSIHVYWLYVCWFLLVNYGITEYTHHCKTYNLTSLATSLSITTSKYNVHLNTFRIDYTVFFCPCVTGEAIRWKAPTTCYSWYHLQLVTRQNIILTTTLPHVDPYETQPITIVHPSQYIKDEANDSSQTPSKWLLPDTPPRHWTHPEAVMIAHKGRSPEGVMIAHEGRSPEGAIITAEGSIPGKP